MIITVTGPNGDITKEVPACELDPEDFSHLALAIGNAVLKAVEYAGGNGDFDTGDRAVRVHFDRLRSMYRYDDRRWYEFKVATTKDPS